MAFMSYREPGKVEKILLDTPALWLPSVFRDRFVSYIVQSMYAENEAERRSERRL